MHMSIAVGDRIPDVEVQQVTPEGAKPVRTGEVLGSGKVVVFAVPGAFTPTCSDYHLPGFLLRSEELVAKGVDRIVCTAVNDAFVMAAWGKDRGVDDQIVLLADGNGAFAEAMGLTMDGSSFGLGTRSKRYAAIVEDGVVRWLGVEAGGGLEASSAEAVLAAL
jgi:peroxiredoxin